MNYLHESSDLIAVAAGSQQSTPSVFDATSIQGAADMTQSVTAASRASHTVLLVDADSENREYLRQEFEAQNFNVLEAEDAHETIRSLSSHRVGAVVLDLELSQRQRAALMTDILSEKCGNPLVFFLVSASVLSREEAYDLGASGAMSKPIHPAYLISRLNALLTPTVSRWKRETHSERNRPVARHKIATSVFKQQLGRGGFTLPGMQEREMLEGDAIEFDVQVESENDRWKLSGTGIVRFVNHDGKSRRQRACGIEFESLDETSRTRLLQNSASLQKGPYIPRWVS